MNYNDIINTKYSEPAAIICYKDGNVSIVEVNDKFIPELWMNVSSEDYIDAYPERVFDKENNRLFVDAVERCVNSGKEQIVETWRLMFSDCCGYDKVCLKSRLVLIEKSSDEAILYEGISNISNEKRAKDTLEDIEYRYKAASEQINIYNWEYTVATKEMRPCYRCMRDLGLPALVTNYPEPAIDMGIFPPDYADMYRDMMRKIDEGIPEIEADIPLTVGRVPFRVKYTTTFDEDGNPVKAFGSATLISDTELGHIKLDNQIISALAESYNCIYLADFVSAEVKAVKQGEFIALEEDATCADLLKYMAEKLQDNSSDYQSMFSDLHCVRTELFKDSDKREFVYKDEDSERWIKIEYQVVERGMLGVDRLIITASVIDDIRAQKMDADRLIALQKAQLEDRQQMLLSAVDEANRANQAKTEFFSNMSHDIRTPMNAITGFSKLALEEIDNRESLEDYLSKIISASEHLLNLINDILDMSRIESGKMELSLTTVSVKSLLNECADMIRVRMESCKQQFIVNVDEVGDDMVLCDKLRFNQVVLNLLSNANKFTPEGGSVSLSGKLLKRDDKLTYEIRVKDTGIGMSDEFKEHIWEAYSREKSEIVHETQGTGLGMLIVRNIVNLMHGVIDLETKLGDGSEFIITIPLEAAVSVTSGSNSDKQSDDALERDYSGINVLVVDDTELNLHLAEHILSKYGFNVRTTESGVDALEIVERSKPGEIDLILMDVMMPVMDGLETTRRIRALEDRELAAIPIVAMTANAFESDVKDVIDAGMNGHIPKPFTKEELITKISSNLVRPN